MSNETLEQEARSAMSDGVGEMRLDCVFDQTRQCGSSCMAYLAQAPTGDTYKGEAWAHCLLLVNTEKLARHVVIAVSMLTRNKAEATRAQGAPKVT